MTQRQAGDRVAGKRAEGSGIEPPGVARPFARSAIDPAGIGRRFSAGGPPAGGPPAVDPAGGPPAGARRLAVVGPPAALVAVGTALGLGALVGAYAGLPGFPDPGALVRWGMPAATVLGELAAATTIGALLLAACVLAPGEPVRRALGLAGWAAAAWALLALARAVLQYAIIAGMPPADPTFGAGLEEFLFRITLGRADLLIVAVAAATSVLALVVRRPAPIAWTAALALSALAVQANSGHAAGTASHELAVSAMVLHLAGAAIWIGGLVAVAYVALRTGRAGGALAADVGRYSTLAGWCYVAVATSGVVNAGIRLGEPRGVASAYGALVLAKVGLVVVLGVAGYAQRTLVVRRLATAEPAARLLGRLIAVELVVMGAVSGVAVALAATPPPVPQIPVGERSATGPAGVEATPAELVTGHVLPPEPTFERWLTQWRWDALFAFACVAALVVYLRWVRRLARRGDRWSPGRTVAWCAGILLLLWATCGGAAQYGHVLFSAHMVQHMVLAMVVPLFLATAAPITLLVRAVPRRRDGSRGPREWVLALVSSRWGRFFANPIVAAANFAGSMIVFYYTPAFSLALHTYVGHVAMVVHFTLAGYLFANALIGVDPGPQRPPYPQRLLLLFATMAFHAFFGVALATGEVLLVPRWFGLLGRPWGPSALADQQLGGGIAWGIGELPTLALAIVVAVMWARSDEREARRRDRRVDRVGDAELDDYNEMLGRLADRDRDRADRG